MTSTTREANEKLCPFMSGQWGVSWCVSHRCMAWKTTDWAEDKNRFYNKVIRLTPNHGYCQLIERKKDDAAQE